MTDLERERLQYDLNLMRYLYDIMRESKNDADYHRIGNIALTGVTGDNTSFNRSDVKREAERAYGIMLLHPYREKYTAYYRKLIEAIKNELYNFKDL